jgi:hypothetical protein
MGNSGVSCRGSAARFAADDGPGEMIKEVIAVMTALPDEDSGTALVDALVTETGARLPCDVPEIPAWAVQANACYADRVAAETARFAHG